MVKAGIEFDGIWKKYRRGEVHDSLRDLVPAAARRLIGRGANGASLARQEFWALQDVSFTVAPGEALGIIGANGAGKSTVLKTLTRIIRPTRGSCRFTGRVGALIEVAAGFHPDLTGRENVFLQGAIMGMPKDLIRRHFDAIVEFSGVEQFIDTPVKRYSSGMNARLGFSIAVHLDPDVLIVDEVLSVGDMQFQRRAFERLTSLVRGGIPVVIVSHQLERIAQMCTRCLWLESGRVAFAGTPAACISQYLAGSRQHVSAGHGEESRLMIRSIEVIGPADVRSGEEVRLRLAGEILAGKDDDVDSLSVRVRSIDRGEEIFVTSTSRCGVPVPSQGGFELYLRLDMNAAPGSYSFEPFVWLSGREVSAGPSTVIHILEDLRFHGSIQLNPRFAFDSFVEATGDGRIDD